MSSVGEMAIQGAQQQAQQSSHTVGDAVQAYHIAATAENARQQLDIQKQENERNKGNWLASQLSNLQKFDGQPEAQKFLLEGLKRQLPMLAPGIDPNALDLLGKDAVTRRALGWQATQALQNGQITEHSFGALVSTLGSPQAVAEAGQHIHDEKMKVEAAQVKGEAIQNPRLQTLGWNKHKAAVSGIVDNKPIQTLLGQKQAIENSLVAYQNSGGMPQELAQLQTSLRINAGTGGTGVSERAEGYATDLGISKAKALQIMGGKIQDTELSSPQIVKAIKAIAQGEIGMKQQQGAQQIAKHAAAYQGIYQNDPYAAVNKPDFDNAVRLQYQQFGLDENGKPQDMGGGTDVATANALKQQWLQTPQGKAWRKANSKQAGVE